MQRNIHSFIIHVVNNLFPLNEYSSGEIKNLMAKFKEEADDLNIDIDDAKLESYIQRFDQLKNSPKIQEKDLRKYSLSKLIKLISSTEGADVDDREDTTPDVVYDDENITIWNGSKENNCINYGRGEKWCITRGSYGNYRYDASKGYPTFYLAKNSALSDSDKLSFVAIQVRDIPEENKRYVYTNRQNSPYESQPMSFSSLMSEIPWLRDIPNIKNILKYIPLSSTEKTTQVYGRSGGEVSIRKWVDMPFSTKKQYLIARKREGKLFSDITNNEFVSQYLPQYPQLATFIAVTPGVLDTILLLKHLDKFSNQDRKSITTNLRDAIDLKELSLENLPFAVKKLLVALNKWNIKSNERLYVTKDGNAIVKLTFGDDVKVGVYTAEDDYPNIKLNKRTSKYLTDYSDLDKIPFNSLLKLASSEVVDKEFINKVLTKAQEDPESAILVKDIEGGKLIVDSNSFTSYKLEGDKISPVSFEDEEVKKALLDESGNSGFQESAVNIVFNNERSLPGQIDKDAFYKILNDTSYTVRTRGDKVILVNPEENKIFIPKADILTNPRDTTQYGGIGKEWREQSSVDFTEKDWKVYFNYLRNQNKAYTEEQLRALIRTIWQRDGKQRIIGAKPPMVDNSIYKPAVIDGKYYLVNTQDPRNSEVVSERTGKLIRASLKPNVVAAALGSAQAAPAAAPTPRAPRQAAAPVARVAAPAGVNANVTAAIENAELTRGFNALPANVRTRIQAGNVVPYTRRNVTLDAIGRVIRLIAAGQSRFYIMQLPSGRVIGFATMQPDAKHFIITSTTAYRVPRVNQLATYLRTNNISEELKTLVRLHSVAIPEEVQQMREVLLNLKNKKNENK